MYCGRPGVSPSTPQSMGLALPGGFKPFSQPPPPPPPSTSPPSVEPTPTELSAPPLDLILQSPIGLLFPKGKCHEGRGSDPPRVAPLNPPLHTHTHNPDVRLPINSHSVHGGGQRERAYARHGNEAVHQEAVSVSSSTPSPYFHPNAFRLTGSGSSSSPPLPLEVISFFALLSASLHHLTLADGNRRESTQLPPFRAPHRPNTSLLDLTSDQSQA
ncbi:hypothetical protein DB88DRAFT_514321 [Papiliotrema laurentii]|uniref:Uncharacterized protein n=1 Tax=Papiliotrema laurentii TaxID=5418 RepID=A0AAD9FVP3_PAPLA|nr:hypothetical protein DB88DRAFT_514321 [Papiliotrema laurentii]